MRGKPHTVRVGAGFHDRGNTGVIESPDNNRGRGVVAALSGQGRLPATVTAMERPAFLAAGIGYARRFRQDFGPNLRFALQYQYLK